MENDVILRPVRCEDIPSLNELRTHPAILPLILSDASETQGDTWHYFLGHCAKHSFVAAKAQSLHNILGYICMNVDPEVRKNHIGTLSMAVTPNLHQKGIGKQMLDYILCYAFRWLRLDKVRLTVLMENDSAIGLYTSRGFVVEGTLRSETLVDGVFKDTYIMGLLAAEYESKAS